MTEHPFVFRGIISGTARCISTRRSLTHLLDLGERGLAVKATAPRYRMVKDRSHPLASKTGLMPLHRKLLFDRIGPGWHPCHWCGEQVEWRVSAPSKGALVVDHVDHDTMNNAPENLVPSCNPCNGHRHRGDEWAPWVPGTPTGQASRFHDRCRQGHPLTPDNVYIRPDTSRRRCLTCIRADKQEKYEAMSPEQRAADQARNRRSSPCPVCGEMKYHGSMRRHIRAMHDEPPIRELRRQAQLAAVLDAIRLIGDGEQKITVRLLRKQIPGFYAAESAYGYRTLVEMACKR